MVAVEANTKKKRGMRSDINGSGRQSECSGDGMQYSRQCSGRVSGIATDSGVPVKPVEHDTVVPSQLVGGHDDVSVERVDLYEEYTSELTVH